jgi:hypothetical protein
MTVLIVEQKANHALCARGYVVVNDLITLAGTAMNRCNVQKSAPPVSREGVGIAAPRGCCE